VRASSAPTFPLKIAAKVDKVDEAHFREEIAPLLSDPGVEFIGEINERRKAEFLGEAQALLFPIDWPEPFGLVMACGTPVLAFRHGSVSEIIDQGVPRVTELDRRAVRATVRTTIFVRSHGQGLCCGLPFAAQAVDPATFLAKDV
jgi:glycosyltransferase involved in cell wall biosynthesis